MVLPRFHSDARASHSSEAKVLLVGSSGGHFRGLRDLESFWRESDRVWVTFRTATTEAVLKDERKYWAFGPTNRNLPNLFRNLRLAWDVIRTERPEFVVSTGAGVAVPFVVLGKLFGARTAFVESITRVYDLSLSARLARPFLDSIYVRWPQLLERYPQAIAIAPERV
ncbi:MAG: UDP-N-acetylglucosamine--LPS N-acetylglucosamine transferase [Cyanobacteria bacterium J06639_1]